MPTNRPAEAEVRGLMAEYSRPIGLVCKKCKKPMRETHDCAGHLYFRCKKCDLTSWVENKYDPTIIALCEDWLRLRSEARRLKVAFTFYEGSASEKSRRKVEAAIGELSKILLDEEPPHA